MKRILVASAPIFAIAALFVVASPAGGQVAIVVGGSVSGFGIGGLGTQSSYTSSDFIIATPGMTAGSITPWPLGIGGYPAYAYPGGFGGPYGYNPYYGGYGYGGYGRPVYGSYWLPPAVLPAETIYGPGAMRRFMGIDPPLGTPIVNNTTIVNVPQNNNNPGFGVLAGGPQVPGRPANVRASNAAAQERARKLISIGDGWFAKLRYADALESYKQAVKAAPDIADGYVRQMAVFIAQQRYFEAVTILKSGLRISTSVIDGNFRIRPLYGDNNLTYTAHLEALAAEAQRQPMSDLWFLTGVMLYFGDDPARAAPFLAKAGQTAVGETWHIAVFNESLKKYVAQNPAPAAAPVANNPAAAPPVRPVRADGGIDL